MNRKMLTAEEFLKEGVEGYSLRDVIDNIEDETLLEIMRFFAKFHVQEALEQASERAVVCLPSHPHLHGSKNVSKNSILYAYPLENIK